MISLLYGINFFLQPSDVNHSILGIISNQISFIVRPFTGENSMYLTSSIIQGLIAKEQVISSLVVSSHLTGQSIYQLFCSNVAIYAFIIFNLFCIPCINTMITLKKEVGLSLTMFVFLFQTTFTFLLSTLIYQIGIRII